MVNNPKGRPNWQQRARHYWQTGKAWIRKGAPYCKKGRQKAGKYFSNIKSYFSQAENVIKVATLVFVGGYTVLTYQQRNIAENTAKATLAANGISQQSLLDSQRPYISISLENAIGSAQNPVGASVFELPIDIQNSGNTWAKHLVLIVTCATPTLATGPIDNKYTGWWPHTDVIIGAPHVTTKGGACGFSAQTVSSVEQGKMGIVIGIDAFYGDVISGNDLWETRFCDEITDLRGDGTNKTPWNWEGIQCPFNNCIDDECKEAPND